MKTPPCFEGGCYTQVQRASVKAARQVKQASKQTCNKEKDYQNNYSAFNQQSLRNQKSFT